MASFGQAAEDGVDDRVRVRFAGREITRTFENYDVHCSVLQQPAAFSTTLSTGGVAAQLLQKNADPEKNKAVPPGTKFDLSVGLFPQFTGYVDGLDAHGAGGSTSVTVKGRDALSKLFDNDVDAEQTFTNVTHASLVRKAMDAVGLEDRKLTFDNKANRNIKSGVRVYTTSEPRVSNEVIVTGSGAAVKHTVRAKLGESWLDFIRRHIAKDGLFLWADANGDFVLSSPNPNQRPLFYWYRERGTLLNRVNVEDAVFHNDTTRRFSEVVIYARNGGKKSGRGKLHGGFVDEEMRELGIDRVKVYRDVNVATIADAEAYARRKIAEANRAGWYLQYTFSGHSAPALYGGSSVITNDLIAHVNDEEFGINEPLYIESVRYLSPPQRTVVTMMRPRDLVFGADS